jgi:hypothetical protein
MKKLYPITTFLKQGKTFALTLGIALATINAAHAQDTLTYGIYTEAETDDGVVLDTDTQLLFWNNLTAVTQPAPEPYEGEEVLALRANAGDWFGFGFNSIAAKDMSAYADGALMFAIKTEYQGQFRVGIKSGNNVESWIDFAAGTTSHGLTRDGEWSIVSIPFTDFENLNLATIDQYFMFAGDAPAAAATFMIDDIYYVTPMTVTSLRNKGTEASSLVGLYPNPAQNELYVTAGTTLQGQQVLVHDVTGRSIFTSRINAGRLDISTLAPGVYVLAFEAQGQPVRKRFVKQ